MTIIYLQKKQDKFLELPLKRFVTGILQVRYVLLDLHPENVFIINQIFKTFFLALLLLHQKKKIAYCRVSSQKQHDDLERQKDFFRHKYPDHFIITDIASGINWKRKGLQTILEQSMQGDISEIVVTHKDRLCRFGFELLEWIFQKYKVKVIILDINQNQKNYQMISYPSSMFFPVNKWENEGIVSRKIRIYPTKKQKLMFRKWIGTSRYVYNRCLSEVKKGEEINFFSLRNKYVTSKNNNNVESWDLKILEQVQFKI